MLKNKLTEESQTYITISRSRFLGRLAIPSFTLESQKERLGERLVLEVIIIRAACSQSPTRFKTSFLFFGRV